MMAVKVAMVTWFSETKSGIYPPMICQLCMYVMYMTWHIHTVIIIFTHKNFRWKISNFLFYFENGAAKNKTVLKVWHVTFTFTLFPFFLWFYEFLNFSAILTLFFSVFLKVCLKHVWIHIVTFCSLKINTFFEFRFRLFFGFFLYCHLSVCFFVFLFYLPLRAYPIQYRVSLWWGQCIYFSFGWWCLWRAYCL